MLRYQRLLFATENGDVFLLIKVVVNQMMVERAIKVHIFRLAG